MTIRQQSTQSTEGRTKRNGVSHKILLAEAKFSPNGEFTRDLSGDDSLCARGREGTLDTMQGKRRLAHAAHEHCRLIIRESYWCARGDFNVLNTVVEVFIQFSIVIFSVCFLISSDE